MYVCILCLSVVLQSLVLDCVMHVAVGHVNSVFTESYTIPNRPFSCGNLSFKCCIHMINH